MKLFILQSLFVWIILIKNIILKTNIVSTNDFIVNFNEIFIRNFESEDKLEKYKKSIIREMKSRIKERFWKNSSMLELLQTRERFKNKNLKSRNFKNDKTKNSNKNLKLNKNNKTSILKVEENFILNQKINLDQHFTGVHNETNMKKKQSHIDFILQNSTLSLHKSKWNQIDSKKSTLSNNYMNSNNNEIYKDDNFSYVYSKQKEKPTIFNPSELPIKQIGNIINTKTESIDQKCSTLKIVKKHEKNGNFSYLNSTSFILKRTKHSNFSRRRKSNTNLDIFDWSFGDINSSKRVTKFYINLNSKCNIFINDTIFYDKDEYSDNFIDHLILRNNFDSIEPRSIYSNDVAINYFIFNKKLNMFTVNFENQKRNNYTIVYEYIANNLIKLQSNKKDFYNHNNNEKNVNEFLWKFYNENTNSKSLSLEVEFYFTIDKSFMNEIVEFNNKMVMYNTLIDNKDTLVFKWNGNLMPYEVKVFESVFPLIFENCQTMTVNFTMILIGAFFVIFIVLVLYLLFSSIAKDLN